MLQNSHSEKSLMRSHLSFTEFWLWVLAALVCYTFTRIVFLIWNWHGLQGLPVSDLMKAFVFGWRFDASAVMALSAPSFLLLIFAKILQKWAPTTWLHELVRFIFCALQLPLMIINMADTELINFVGRRFTYDSLFLVSESKGKVSKLILTYPFLNTAHILVISFFIFALYKLIPQIRIHALESKIALKVWIRQTAITLLSLIALVIGIRGGLQLKPIGFAHARVFAHPMLNSMTLNSAFTFITSAKRESLKREHFFEKEKMLTLLNGSLRSPSLLNSERGSWHKRPMQNVVIIIVESLSLEYMGLNSFGTNAKPAKSYTPFLDQLAQKSLFFSNGFANGRRSIEGVAAVLGGVPALMNEPFISSQYQTNTFYGLGALLKPAGYETLFFHGGMNGTMFFDQFSKSAGFDEYIGMNEYPNRDRDFDGTWGIWDEEFLQFMAEKLSSIQKPFAAGVFTLSSHHPFVVPQKYDRKFENGPVSILKSISYTDYSIEQFFKTAEKQPWYKNTLFIITADHTSLNYRPEFNDEIGRYRVPIILYHPCECLLKNQPHEVLQKLTEQPTQQIDVIPTVLDFLEIKQHAQNYLGQSMFILGDHTAVDFLDGRHYLMASDGYLIRSVNGEIKAFDYGVENANGITKMSSERINELNEKMKANIQYFSEGLWDNRLYFSLQ